MAPMKCDRCNGLKYIEPSDGKRQPCSKCGGKGVYTPPPSASPTDTRERSGVYRPGFEFDFKVGTWVRTGVTEGGKTPRP